MLTIVCFFAGCALGVLAGNIAYAVLYQRSVTDGLAVSQWIQSSVCSRSLPCSPPPFVCVLCYGMRATVQHGVRGTVCPTAAAVLSERRCGYVVCVCTTQALRQRILQVAPSLAPHECLVLDLAREEVYRFLPSVGGPPRTPLGRRDLDGLLPDPGQPAAARAGRRGGRGGLRGAARGGRARGGGGGQQPQPQQPALAPQQPPCPVCLVAPISTVFICGHGGCAPCMARLLASGTCHICRSVVTRTITLYHVQPAPATAPAHQHPPPQQRCAVCNSP